MSAVIPAHNAERFIADAVKSVLSQTYPAIECIVVDDGSTDGTYAAVRACDGDAVIVQQVQQGVSRARNSGIERARGEYVAFLDADDVWLPTKIEEQVAVAAKNPAAALIYCGLFRVDERLKVMGEVSTPPVERALRNTLLLEPPGISVAQACLIRRDVLVEIRGFDERLSTSADTDVACRIAARYPIARLDKPLVFYREHEQQMHRNPAAMEHDMTLVFERVFSDPEIGPALRPLKARAYANLQAAVGIEYLAHGDVGMGLRHLALAARHQPRRLTAILTKLFLIRVGRRLDRGASRAKHR